MYVLAVIVALGGLTAELREERVAVLPVDSRATLPEATSAQLRGSVERGLARASVEVLDDAEVDELLGSDTCSDVRCVQTLVAATSSAWVLRSTITMMDSVYVIQLDALDRDGRTLASASGRCEICGAREVVELTEDRSAALVDKVNLLRRQAPRLVVRSSPEGARVWVDGQIAGRTPLTLDVDVGVHDVRVAEPGYLTERREVRSVAGTSDELELVLLPKRVQSGSRAPWLGLGTAALAVSPILVGAGVGLVAIDEREYQRDCNADIAGNCSHRFDTMAGGVALLVSGGMLLASGVTMVVVGRRARQDDLQAQRRWRVGRGLTLEF